MDLVTFTEEILNGKLNFFCIFAAVIIGSHAVYIKLAKNHNFIIISARKHMLKVNYKDVKPLFKVNNRNSKKRCKICSMLTIKIPEQR